MLDIQIISIITNGMAIAIFDDAIILWKIVAVKVFAIDFSTASRCDVALTSSEKLAKRELLPEVTV